MADSDDPTVSLPAGEGRQAPPRSEPDSDESTRSLAPSVPVVSTDAYQLEEVFVDEPERYTIAGQIGAGGMGTVLAATGARLGRAVALKVVTVDRADLRRRFEREAQVTARLQHPAIVPIYGTGRGRNGQPFYAMKQVIGEPLDKLIGKTPRGVALLPNVIAVTEAIAYAHAEHIIHRDLKPANILVGAFGETVVIDWGLAKDLATADDVQSWPPLYRGSGDETAVGKVMGTPAYMPVEQARGDRVDERADVYALGAILYHVLAGVHPYTRAGETGLPWETTLARVLAGSPEPLASREVDVPPDLLAIVDRAMARAPEDRYPSAGELAADLRRFQTGQLVGAHRYSTWELVRRWLRLHRAAVSVGAALLVVLAVVSVISVQRIRQERSDAEAARALADDQRALAVASRNEAEDLMGFMLGDLKDKLQPVGKLDIIDAVAKKTMAFYERQPDAGTDAERRQRAQAFMNVGEVLQPQGNLDGALAAFRAALAIREVLARTPGNHGDQAAAAVAHDKIGAVLGFRGDGKGAVAEFRASLELAQQAVGGDPSNLELQATVAAGELDLGDALLTQNDLTGAMTAMQICLAIRGQLAAVEPTSTRWLHELSKTNVKLGDIELARGDLDAAIDALRASRKLVEKLVGLEPRNAVWKRDLTVPFGRLGDVLMKQQKVDAALVEYRGGLAIIEQLVALDPTNTEWLRDAMVAHRNLGSALSTGKTPASALPELRQALELTERLVQLDPANAEWRRDRAAMHQALGIFLGDRGDVKGALAEFATSRTLDEALAAGEPSNMTYQLDLAALHNMAGNVLSGTNEPDKVHASVPEFEAAIAAFEAIVGKEPDRFEYELDLAQSLQNLANAYGTFSDPRAIEPNRKALAHFDKLAHQQPTNHDVETSQTEIHFNLGELTRGTQPEVARAEYRAAAELIERLVRADPKNERWQAMQVEIKKQLAGCCKPAAGR